jgi:hypothetical protein
MDSYPEVWECQACWATRTYGVQPRPFGPFNLERVHVEGASLHCRRCKRATPHKFKYETEAQGVRAIPIVQEEKSDRN